MACGPFNRPNVTSCLRREAGTVRPGDEATLSWDPALLHFLISGNPRPGAGTHPMSGVPLGVMTEAALVAGGREETGIDVLAYANVTFRTPVPADRAWLAWARVEEVKERHVVVRAELRSPAGQPVYAEAILGVARVVEGKTSSRLLSGKALESATM